MIDTLATFLGPIAVVAFIGVMYMLGSRHERKYAEKRSAELQERLKEHRRTRVHDPRYWKCEKPNNNLLRW
jgi:hypothetical protein